MARKDGGLRKIFRQHLRQVHWTTVESILTEAGIPDSNGCFKGVEFWIEFKLARGWKVSMREGQIGWISQRVRHGGRVFVAVRKGKELWLVHGKAVAQLATHGLRGLRASALAGRWQGGIARWPWPAIAAVLSGH